MNGEFHGAAPPATGASHGVAPPAVGAPHGTNQFPRPSRVKTRATSATAYGAGLA